MKEIVENKKVEVAQRYILGLPYKEIEEQTGVSHGSIVNIVKEIGIGKLNIPGTPLDQVNDLRHLALDLKKKGLSPAQALLGVTMFERANQAGISPDYYDEWADLMKAFSQNGFPTTELIETATKLRQLEVAGGKSYETATQELKHAQDDLTKVKDEVISMKNDKDALSKEITAQLSEKETLGLEEKKRLSEVDLLTERKKQLESDVSETKEERSQVKLEVGKLKLQRTKLAAEVDDREIALARINELGLTDKDLFRVKKALETIAQSSAGQAQIKDKFFTALDIFKDIAELKKRHEEEKAALDHLTDDNVLLTGQIIALEQSKNIIQGEMKEAIVSSMDKIKETGNKAARELQQQVDIIKQGFDGLVVQAAEVGMAIGEMKAAVKKGEESGVKLSNFIREIRTREVKTNG